MKTPTHVMLLDDAYGCNDGDILRVGKIDGNQVIVYNAAENRMILLHSSMEGISYRFCKYREESNTEIDIKVLDETSGKVTSIFPAELEVENPSTSPRVGNPSALETQVGGNHYKDMKIQPIEFTMQNGLNFCQGNVIKYVTRYKAKNGIEDLKKAKHYIDLLIDFESRGTK